MQLGGKPQTITLKVDLTRYNSACKEGAIGTTVPNYKVGFYGSYDHFVAVKFENGAILDIAYNSLEIIKEK